ncbi:hypothetical protein Q8F55_006640 [Vanrija albida]|uniref:RRM domain-containing protein n=1 Tax=Vanrija albida TaxID=181172 RepID=A0ABR3PYP4_9TREE
MTTPPSSLPSPTPSSGSSGQQHKPQSFSSIAALHTSSASSTSPPSLAGQSVGAPGDGAPSREASFDAFSDEAQQTPPAGSNVSGFHNVAFLPQVTASPPPHAPPYVPPAQHAMAPDPIHSLSLSGQAGSVWAPGWRPGPPGPGPGYAHPQGGYGRGGPNGHLTHQLPPNPLEAYGPGSRQSMTSTPGVAPLGSANGDPTRRTGSQPGEPRDRRRERHREEEGREREDEEVISTIFVVGFPDDMSEREFQNVFTFAPGFEAATLKFPSGSARREPAAAAALLAELQHLAANQGGVPAGLLGSEHPDQPLDETFASMNFGTQSSSASNTPSAAMSLTPSAPSGATLGTANIPPSVPPRRQTIGFARFKTRADALAARDHLQGRRIDTLTGATLKAEMAKKNLHTKRGVGGDDLVGILLRSGRLSQLVNQQAQAQQAIGGAPGIGQPNAAGPIGAPVVGLNTGAAQSAKEAWDAWPAPAQAGSDAKVDKLAQSQRAPSAQSTASGSPPLSVKSPNARPTDSKALLALAEEADELEGWSVGSVGLGGMTLDYPGAPGGPRSAAGPGGPLPVGAGIAPPNSAGLQHGAIGFNSGGSGAGYSQYPPAIGSFGGSGPQDGVDPRSLGIGTNMNPADQNPPINTLYIGNLPAISPPTHPPNFLEESLRALFHRRPGFKRMSFRQKINGPMCFVEFEDIPFATQAMRELYGNTLNGLVKGGIRLSYSKNSLGQRGNSHQQGVSTSMFGGIAHTVALAGMSSGPSGNQLAPGAPGGGFLGPSPPVPIGSSSSTATTPGADPRRPSEGSSLSPTAQPFNAPLPNSSPRSQRYYGGERPAGTGSGSPPANIPGGNQQEAAAAAFNSFAPSSASQSGFSPVSSPIRTPASLGWVSSSSGGGASGGTYGAFEAFGMPPHGLPSLNGAASAWGANAPNAS